MIHELLRRLVCSTWHRLYAHRDSVEHGVVVTRCVVCPGAPGVRVGRGGR